MLGGGGDSELRTASDLPRSGEADAAPQRRSGEASDFPVIIGEPYNIGNTVQVPFDKMSFDEVGYAAVIPPAMAGRPTANGEAMSTTAFAGAHRTLPVPSYVEVTSITNGRTVLVRINDRGPMLPDRVIALSLAAAEHLGLNGDGTSPVRVRRVNPPEQERAVLRAGGKAASRLETPPGLRSALRAKLPPAPAPLADAVHVVDAMPPEATVGPARGEPGAVTSVPVPPSVPAPTAAPSPAPVAKAGPAGVTDRFIVEQAGARQSAPARPGASFPPPPLEADRPSRGGYAVQVGAFSDSARAASVAQATGAQVIADGKLYRVRTTPFGTAAAARAALAAIQAKGYADARVVVNDRQ